MSEVGSVSLRLVLHALKTREKELDDKPMSLQEAKLVAEIFADVDKIIKLDQGQPTERFEIVPIQMKDLRDALIKDKFLDIVPTEARPVIEPEIKLNETKE